MAESQYLEKYGFTIFFTDKELEMLGKEVEITKGSEVRIGKITDLSFGESIYHKDDKRYLTIKFAIDDWWSGDFPTEILEPPIYEEYTKETLKNTLKQIQNENKRITTGD